MSNFTSEFTKRQLDSFEQFGDPVSESVIGNFAAAVAEYLKKKFEENDEAELKLPHGTYTAAQRKSGEKGNINVALEFNKAFNKALNDDERLEDDMIPKEFVKLYQDFVMGEAGDIGFVPVVLEELEAIHFLKAISTQIAETGKTYAKESQVYSFEIPNHGKFFFEYEGDKIVPRFEADKVFKQALKDDSKLEE